MGSSSDSLISISSSSSATKAGAYAINISQLATKAKLTGDLALGANTAIAANTKLAVTLNGVTADVSLTEGSYTQSALSTLIQSAINSTSAFSSVGSTVTVAVSGNLLSIESEKYGSASTVSIADSSGTSYTTLTGTITTGTTAVDVAGSFAGASGSGSGQTLTAGTGSNADGLKLLVVGGSTGARGTVNYSIGYASSLQTVITGFNGASGTIQSSTNNINQNIKALTKQREILNSRLFDVEARYRAQFTALDRIISNLNNTSSFLTQQLNALNNSNS